MAIACFPDTTIFVPVVGWTVYQDDSQQLCLLEIRRNVIEHLIK